MGGLLGGPGEGGGRRGPEGMLAPPSQIIGGGLAPHVPPLPTPMISHWSIGIIINKHGSNLMNSSVSWVCSIKTQYCIFNSCINNIIKHAYLYFVLQKYKSMNIHDSDLLVWERPGWCLYI